MLCGVLIIINLTALPLNKLDMQHLNFAKKRCAILKPHSPCLKKFIKVEERVYRAICGTTEQSYSLHK